MLQSMGLQTIGYDQETEQQQQINTVKKAIKEKVKKEKNIERKVTTMVNDIIWVWTPCGNLKGI